MPDHGSASAASPCCRPPVNQATLAHTEPRGFWADLKAWKFAGRNTRNCLIGCSIGDFGMLIYLQAFHPGTPMWLTMALAMTAGLVTSIIFESLILHWKEGFGWKAAVMTAFSMSFLSMLGMEFAANTTDFMLTGGRVPLHEPWYWIALGISLLVGYLVPLPYNYWRYKAHGKACH